MSVSRMDEVWEVRGLPVVADPSQESAEPRCEPERDGGVTCRVAIARKERFVRLEQERRREMRLVESRIEQAAVDEARRMDKLLGYGDDDITTWKQRIEPHHFNTYSAGDFVTLMGDLHAIYRGRLEIISECISRQMALEAERTARLRDVFKKYHPLLTRAFHKMPAEVEEQLELEAVAINEMILNNLRQYSEIRFNRLTGEVQAKQKLKDLWKVRRDAWRSLNILQAQSRLSGYLATTGVEDLVEAPLAELETEMATVWQHYQDHVTGLPDLFLKQVTDESLDQWQDEAYEILNAMSTMFTTHCKSYRRLYLDLENAWYEQLEKVGDDLVNREVTDVDSWEALADEHTATMFGPIRQKVENIMQESEARWKEVVEAAPTQVDHLYSYIASSCEIFSLHLAERERYAKKLELQLEAVDTQQAGKEVQLEQKINKSVIAMLEESKVNKVHQLQQTLARNMMGFLPTYEQCQERRLQLLLSYSERLESETSLVQLNVAEKLQGTVTSAEPPPEEPPDDCHRLLRACRGVLLAPERLKELQSVSAANILWFLSWERRRLEQDLGDFLLEKLKLLKNVFDSKANGLSLRVTEIEKTVHDKRSSEIQLHQQRVDSHCRSVTEKLTELQSHLAEEIDWMRLRLDQDRAWMAQHEARSRLATRSYALELMLNQVSAREGSFLDCLVERSCAFRQRVVAFSADLVASTEAFLRQLIPQADPAASVEPRPAAAGPSPPSAGSGRAVSMRESVLRRQAKLAALKQGQASSAEKRRSPGSHSGEKRHTSSGHSSKGSRRTSRRVSAKKEKEEEVVVGNFSNDEITKYKTSLKKLLFTIEQTGKINVKSLEHKMETFCSQLDDSIKKAEASIKTQIGDVKLSESMQHSYVSVQTLIKSEIKGNQEETVKTWMLIGGLKGSLNDYESKWASNLRRESQINVFFQPTTTIEWEEKSVGLSTCIAEGVEFLDRVGEIFSQIHVRHQYVYCRSLDGAVSFHIVSPQPPTPSEASLPSGGEVSQTMSAPPAATHLPSGGSVSRSALEATTNCTTVRLDDSAAQKSLRSGRNRFSGTRSAEQRSSRVSDGSGQKHAGFQSPAGPEHSQGGQSAASATAEEGAEPAVAATPSSGTALTRPASSEEPGTSSYAADVSATQESNNSNAAGAKRKSAKSPKRSRREREKKKQLLSKLDDSEVRALIFGDVEEPDDSENFINKIKRKIWDVLGETKDTAFEFYLSKGSRAVSRPDLIPGTHEEFLELVYARFQAYYAESARYQLACFAEFCDEFTEFVAQAIRIPGLVFRHQAALYCRKVAGVTRACVSRLAVLQQAWRQTSGELERRLRPGLGHPNRHAALLQLVEQAVAEKEAYAGRVGALDAEHGAARGELELGFERSTAYVAQRCGAALAQLSGAGHLSPAGLQALNEALTAAVQEARQDCERAWAGEEAAAVEAWSSAVGQVTNARDKWEAAWFGGVQTIQELFRACEV